MEKEYLNSLMKIKIKGIPRTNRTGVDTKSLFGDISLSYKKINKKFPAITTKKLAWNAVVSELLWFLEGSTDERRLAEIQYGTRDITKTTIWTQNADNQGIELGYENSESKKELGPIYGKQWRDFNGVDQIQSLIYSLKNDPYSRRHILSAWNVSDIDKMALPPCHLVSQFYVDNKNRLYCHLYQRSADMFLGIPFNIASYSLLTSILAKICGYTPYKFSISIGDAHIYKNHETQIMKQTSRIPFKEPKLVLPNFYDLDSLLSCKIQDFILKDYKFHPPISAKMAI